MERIIALAGNPNSGKTTLFNALTGARQHIGNYPGVTVDKKVGTYADNGRSYEVVDLPGTYSLTAYSPEELAARNFIVDQSPGAVVNILDASNLERNLYLTIQLMEMGVPVCIALNMIDAAKSRGVSIDDRKLSELTGVPVTPTVARKGRGKAELMAAVGEMLEGNLRRMPLVISYGEDIDNGLAKMEREISAAGFLNSKYPPRWIALKYLENDQQVMELGRQTDLSVSARLEAIASFVARRLKGTTGSYPEAVIADHRYGYINSLVRQGVVRREAAQNRLFLTDKIDRVVVNRFLGPIIMLGIILGLYHFTFTYSAAPVEWMDGFFGWLGGALETRLPDGLLKSLILSGVIDGVGGVIGFTPLIMFMFFGIALLEDSGYLARMAFMLDRVFRIFGLHGNSVMAFIVSGGIAGGCAVPGVMAARTLKSPKERLATLLTVPFMNCGAKLPVFALLTAAFFSSHEALVMFLITLVSWGGALGVARLLRSTVIRGEPTPFVMELPPYRLPTLKGLLIHTWERTWQYLKKAGTVILGISILLWAFMTFPGLREDIAKDYAARRQAALDSTPAEAISQADAVQKGGELSAASQDLKKRLGAINLEEAEAALRHSLAGRFGTALESVSQLAGFDWRTNIALVGGFAAKEVVVSTLGTAYSLGEVDPEEPSSLSTKLASAPGWSAVAAVALIVFTIFYAPCFAAVVCISKEAGGWKWGAFSVVFNTGLAFGLAVLVYQIGSALGLAGGI